MWTLLKQNPYANPHQQGVCVSGADKGYRAALIPNLISCRPLSSVGKVLIACPVTLVTNWSKEFRKWLGRDALGVFIGDGDKKQIRQFANSRRHQVLIIGYEKVRPRTVRTFAATFTDLATSVDPPRSYESSWKISDSASRRSG